MKLNVDPSYVKGLVSELKIMIHIGKHLNIINLLGACTGNIKESNTTLTKYLLENIDHVKYTRYDGDCWVLSIWKYASIFAQ